MSPSHSPSTPSASRSRRSAASVSFQRRQRPPRMLPRISVALPLAVTVAALVIGLPVNERADRNAFAADMLMMAAAVPAAAASAVPAIRREFKRARGL